MMLEIGKTYSFKTMTFYYIGTVVQLFGQHAQLKDATEVYETGPNVNYYAGTIRAHERIPDGTLVPIGSGVVIMPWSHVVPARGNI